MTWSQGCRWHVEPCRQLKLVAQRRYLVQADCCHWVYAVLLCQQCATALYTKDINITHTYTGTTVGVHGSDDSIVSSTVAKLFVFFVCFSQSTEQHRNCYTEHDEILHEHVPRQLQETY